MYRIIFTKDGKTYSSRVYSNYDAVRHTVNMNLIMSKDFKPMCIVRFKEWKNAEHS